MELLLVAALIALLRWAAGRFSEPGETEAVPPPVPPAPPRRVRRAPASLVPAPAEPREEGPAPAELPPPRVALPAVVRPAPSPHARDFATRAALRRAVVAREVLGKPLSLR